MGGYIKTQGNANQGHQVPINNIINANRGEVHSQGGVRSLHNKNVGIVVTDAD